MLKPIVLFALLAAAPAARADGSGRRFTYASWNVGHYALGTNWCSGLTVQEARERAAAYSNFLGSVGADVLGVCEYSGRFSKDGAVDALMSAFARYDRHVIGPGCDADDVWRCNACLWKEFVHVSSRVRAFSCRRDPDVAWLENRLKIGLTEVVFAQVHLDWNNMDEGFENVRMCQMRELVNAYRGDRHVVISGDFNVGVRSCDENGNRRETIDDPSEYDVFAKAGYELGNDGRYLTSQHGVTSDGRRGCSLDNIIVKGMRMTGFRMWPRFDLSDHALVSATLEPETTAPADAAPCGTTEAERPLVMFRFSSAQTQSLEEWRQTAQVFAANRGCCDEVWFSTGESFPGMDWHRRNVAVIREAAEDMRKLGIRASIQFEATVGHGDDFPTAEEKARFDKPWTGWTGPDGTECRYCNCPRQSGFLRRLAEISELYATIRPAVVWIDDDLRLTNHSPVSGADGPGCWCDKCLADFSRRDGRTWTRAELQAAWKGGDAALRDRWEDFSSESMAELASVIARSFRKVSPKTRFGLQTGAGRERMVNIVLRRLKDMTGEKTAVRMGGGDYYDLSPIAQLAKSRQMVTACRRLEAEDLVDGWCTEVESYPRAYGSRSVRSIALEAFSSIAWGLDSVSLFVMDRRSESDGLYSRYLLKPLVEVTKFLNDYRALHVGTVPAGFVCPEAGDECILTGVPVLPGWGRSWGAIDAERSAGVPWGQFGDDRLADVRLTPSAKIQAVRDRLSEKAPLKVLSPFAGLVLPRVSEDGALRSVGLIGARLDAQEIVLQLDVPERRFVWRELGRTPQELLSLTVDGHRQVTVPSLGAWNAGYLLVD